MHILFQTWSVSGILQVGYVFRMRSKKKREEEKEREEEGQNKKESSNGCIATNPEQVG